MRARWVGQVPGASWIRSVSRIRAVSITEIASPAASATYNVSESALSWRPVAPYWFGIRLMTEPSESVTVTPLDDAPPLMKTRSCTPSTARPP